MAKKKLVTVIPGLPPIDPALAKTPSEIDGLWNAMVSLGQSYGNVDQREQEYQKRLRVADQALDRLAEELEYEKAFWRLHGRYPVREERFHGAARDLKAVELAQKTREGLKVKKRVAKGKQNKRGGGRGKA